MLKQTCGLPFREVLQAQTMHLINMAFSPIPPGTVPTVAEVAQKAELQYDIIKFVSILVKQDPKWITGQVPLVSCLRFSH